MSNFIFEDIMSEINITLYEAKKVIAEKITSGIDFRTLRKELSGISRRNIKLLVLEIMNEQRICEIPFPWMLKKRITATSPLPLSVDGTIDVQELLAQKGFTPEMCTVRYFFLEILLSIKMLGLVYWLNTLPRQLVSWFYSLLCFP